MTGESGVGQVELGRYLAQVREGAGIKQAELARSVTWSPAVLSRVEAGERHLSPDELEMILAAIATPEANRLREAVGREWSVLPKPPLAHPDQDLLWAAEQVAKELIALRNQADVRNAFGRRLDAYVAEIQQAGALLLKRDHQVAFIGSIGIGKSTAICRLIGLEVADRDGAIVAPVLEAGAGGITVCEVHVRTGPSYGLMIEPRSDEEIRADVADFADHLMGNDRGEPDDAQGGEGNSQGISKEIERALRNMSSLKVRREKGSDGKTVRRDEAMDLAQSTKSQRELVVEILARMELHKRDRRDSWFDSSCGKSELVWLKDIFEEVNNGRHADFTLPKRIEVVVPNALLGVSDLSIRIVDTKGIDGTAARADLEVHLDEPHTLAVLCSGFNNAPAAEPKLLLERAREAGVRTLETHTALLVLPRPEEAVAVKDDSGTRVETSEEGYELKDEQIRLKLGPLGLRDFAVGFFNARQDRPDRLRTFLAERINKLRQTFRARMHEITTNARALLLNHEQEQAQEAIRGAAKMLRSWSTQNSAFKPLGVHVADSLMAELARANPSTIRATMRREGDWPNLKYSHQLGYGARRIAALSLDKAVRGFSELCKTMSGNPDYSEAKGLISQAERVLLASYEDLLRKVQVMGQTSFRNELKLDANFWRKCDAEWGRGPGYRGRVTERNTEWFRAEGRKVLERELRTLIDREWKQALEKLTSLFDEEQ